MPEAANEPLVGHWQLLDLRIDSSSRQVWRGAERLNLQGLSLDLLLYLVQQEQRVVSAEELFQAVWQGRLVSDETLTQRVKLLRQVLGDDSRAPRYLRSVRGTGYQLCAPALPLAARRSSSILRRRLAYVLAFVICVGGAVLWYFATTQTQPALAPPGTLPSSAVAVNEVLAQARSYQQRGQADDNERALQLYRHALTLDAGSIPAQVGLSHALSQRVCLFNGAGELLLEAEQLARAIIASGQGGGDGHSALAHVYDCRGWVDAALAQYQRALEYSPQQAADLASYAYLLMVRGQLVDALELNLRAAQQQQELHFLDLQVAHVLELLGFADAAELRYRRTFELYPDNVFGNLAYPRFLYLQGHLEQAQQRLDEALSRAVPRPGLYLLQAELALLRQQPEQASAALAQAMQVNPQRAYAATLHRLHSETLVTVPATQDLPSSAVSEGVPPPPERFSPEPWQEQAMAEIQASVDAGDTWPDTWLQVALLQLSLGQRAAALEALEEALAHGFLDRNYLLLSPWFAELHQEPGFHRLLEQMSEQLRSQRQSILEADWLPPGLLVPVGTAASLDPPGEGV